MVPIKRQIDNDDHYEGNEGIKYIVLHDTGNVTDSDEGNANYFNTGSRQASAHYFVDDDSITQVVEDFNSSWHCGDGNGKYGITNRNSIGIEMCRINNSVSLTTEANTLNLVKMLMNKHSISIDRVVRHYDASHKNCPSSFNNDGEWSRWTAFKNQLRDSLNKKESVKMPEIKEPVDNFVVPKGDNITPLNGGGWIEVATDGRIILHRSKCTYVSLSLTGEVVLTHYNQTQRLGGF